MIKWPDSQAKPKQDSALPPKPQKKAFPQAFFCHFRGAARSSALFVRSQIIYGDLVETPRPIPGIIRNSYSLIFFIYSKIHDESCQWIFPNIRESFFIVVRLLLKVSSDEIVLFEWILYEKKRLSSFEERLLAGEKPNRNYLQHVPYRG